MSFDARPYEAGALSSQHRRAGVYFIKPFRFVRTKGQKLLVDNVQALLRAQTPQRKRRFAPAQHQEMNVRRQRMQQECEKVVEPIRIEEVLDIVKDDQEW